MSTSTPAVLGHLDVSFLPENARSRNKRFYPATTVQRTVQMAQEDLARGVPLTNFALHADGLADDASKMTGRISKVWMESGKARARIDILATSKGRDIAAVAKAGGIKTVSLRSADYRASPKVERAGGKSDAYEEVEHCRIAGIDFAPIPGIEDATVDAVVLESLQAQAEREGRLLEALDVDDAAYTDLFEQAYQQACEGWLGSVKQSDLDDGDFAWLSDDGKTRKLPYKIHGKVSERGWRAAWNAVHGARSGGMDFSGGPSKEATIKTLLASKPAGVTVSSNATEQYEACSNPACDPLVCTCGASCAGTESAPCGCMTRAMEEPTVAIFTHDEIKGMLAEAAHLGARTLLEEQRAAIAASYQPPLVEARHAHDHTHQNADGSSYQHDHAHNHDGALDHGNAMSHAHGHNASMYESASTGDGSGSGTTTPPPSATESSEMKAEDVQKLITEAVSGLKTELTETLTAKTQATEEAETLRQQLTEAQQAKADAEKAKADAEQAAETLRSERKSLLEDLGKTWRPKRQVPVEALASLVEGEADDRELSVEEAGKLALEAFSASVATAAGHGHKL